MKSTADLIADVKDRAAVPADDERINDSFVLKLLNQCVDEYIYPTLLKISEEFNVVKTILNLTTDSGTSAFPSGVVPLPKRAYGRVLRELKYLDPSNNLVNIPYVSLQDEDAYITGSAHLSAPFGYYFIGDSVKLIPRSNDSILPPGKLVLHYIIEASTLENSDSLYAPIYSMDHSESSVRFIVKDLELLQDLNDYCPPRFSKTFDLYRKSSGALIAADLLLTRETSLSGDTYYASTELDPANVMDIQNFQQGGFPVTDSFEKELLLLPSGRSPFSTLPYELDNLLAQKAAGRVLEVIGDTESLQINEARVREILNQVTSALGNRSRGESRKIVNRRSILRDMRRQHRRNW